MNRVLSLKESSGKNAVLWGEEFPKVVTVRKSNGKKEKVVAYPTFLFEVVEKLKANQIQIN